MAVQRQKKLLKEAPESPDVHWPFGPKNYMLFGLALADIILGFILLDSGSLTAAPILLVLGFCVLIPLAIIVDGLPKSGESDPTDLLK